MARVLGAQAVWVDWVARAVAVGSEEGVARVVAVEARVARQVRVAKLAPAVWVERVEVRSEAVEARVVAEPQEVKRGP